MQRLLPPTLELFVLDCSHQDREIGEAIGLRWEPCLKCVATFEMSLVRSVQRINILPNVISLIENIPYKVG